MTTPPAVVAFHSEGIDERDVAVHTIDGVEEMGRLYTISVVLHTREPRPLDEAKLLGRDAAISITSAAGTRWIRGVIATFRDELTPGGDHFVVELELVPRAHRLSLSRTSAVFVDRTVPEIIAAKLAEAGFTLGADFELRLTATYPPREFTLQYEEADLHFVSRIAEHVGIAFFFEQGGDREVMVFSDDKSAFTPLPGDPVVRFSPRGEEMGVYALQSISRLRPKGVTLRDYNYRTPSVAILESHDVEPNGAGAIVEFGAHAFTSGEAELLARVRAEELACERRVFEGKSDDPRLAPGAAMRLERHPRYEGGLHVVRVEHHGRQTTWLFSEGATPYRNDFTAIAEDVPYRPRRVTPRPRVHGAINAVVEAEQAGDYAEIDGDGRYRVRLVLDPGGAPRGKASSLLRMAQPHAGPGYGLHFPLRDGVEVLVAFVEGDPDRPVILGAVPNPSTPSVVTSRNSTRNVLRTGGGTEMNIDDTDGGTRFKITVPHKNTFLQLGAPNDPTEGFSIGTDGDATFTAKQSVTIASSASYMKLDAMSTIDVHANTTVSLRSSRVEVIAENIDDGATTKYYGHAPDVQWTCLTTGTFEGGKMVVDGWGSATLKSAVTATVDAPHVVIKGGPDVKVTGDKITLTAGGSEIELTDGGIKIKSGGPVAINGTPIKLNC